MGGLVSTSLNEPLEIALEQMLDVVDMSEYWSYEGSLTTPPCSEGIRWSVIKQVQPISQSQLDNVTRRLAGDSHFAEGKGNNRQVQPLNDRTLYFTGESADTELVEHSSASGILVSLGALVGATVAALTF